MVPIVNVRSLFVILGAMRTSTFPGGSSRLAGLGLSAFVLLIVSIVAGPPLLRVAGSSSKAVGASVSSQWAQTLVYKIQVTEGALVKAGLLEPALDFGPDGADEIDVAVKLRPTASPASAASPAAFDTAARVTWRTFPDLLRTIVVTVDDLPAHRYVRPQLLASFGQRPTEFDGETMVQDSLLSILVYLVLALDAVAVVIAAPVVAVRAVRGTARAVNALLKDR